MICTVEAVRYGERVTTDKLCCVELFALAGADLCKNAGISDYRSGIPKNFSGKQFNRQQKTQQKTSAEAEVFIGF